MGSADSLENRQVVLEEIRRSLGIESWEPSKLSLDLKGLVPAGFHPENKSALYAPLAAFRAKCIVTILPTEPLAQSMDDCFRLEAEIGAALDADDFGYVDGNDVGDGCFRVFCYGRRKAKLIQLVTDVVNRVDWAKVTAGGQGERMYRAVAPWFRMEQRALRT